MKKVQNIEIPNLRDIPFEKALQIAYAICPFPYEEIADRMGLGRETIHRYFTDPEYNPPSRRIPKLCTVMGNYLLIEWQAAQVNGQVIFADCRCDEGHFQSKIGEMTKEFSDVLRVDAEAMMNDGKRDDDELSDLEKELVHLSGKIGEIKALIQRKRGKETTV